MTRLAERAEFSRFFESCSDLLCVLGVDGRIKEANRAWEAVLGWSAEELKRRPWLSFVHPKDRAKTRAAFAGLGAARPSLRLENRWKRKGGGYLWLCWSASIGEGFVFCVAREESESKRQQSRLKEELVQAEKMASVGLLLGGIAHELSNPLTTILGHVQLLLLENAAPSQLQQDLSLILRETGRCTRLIKSLMTFARKEEHQRIPADLNQLVNEMLELKGHDLRRNGITLSKQLAPGLPPVLVDPHQVQQVLLNLLNNAEHAMEGLRGGLCVETFVDAGHVALAVTDSGPGIRAEVLPRLFEAFFTTKPVGKGTGLGLSICERIVREHGGTIKAESGSGAHPGARFIVRLPAAVRPEPRPAARPAASRLLVIDDDADVLRFMGRALRQADREVDAFSSAAEGLDALARTSYDVVISDFHMPGTDGRDFYRQAVARRPELAGRFILLTGEGNLTGARLFSEAEGVSLLVKPFELKEFDRVLRRLSAPPARAAP